MSALSHTHYVPFLKGKEGELNALAQLTVEERGVMTPLIDVPPQQVKFERDSQGISFQIESLDNALDGYAAKIVAAWHSVDECFVDIAGFDPDLRLNGGRHPLTKFFADAKEVNLAAIPVTGPDRDVSQINAVKAVCKKWRLGAAIRLRGPMLVDPTALTSILPRLIQAIDQEPDHIDLLLDFGELLNSNEEEVEEQARSIVKALTALSDWRSLVLCSGGFPAQISDFIGTQSSGERSRRDWELWHRLVFSEETLTRLPSFGDYGTASADWQSPFNPFEMNPSAKVVYATDHQWLIEKGRSFRDFGGAQYRELSAQMKARSEFLKGAHCQTESKIIECAAGRGGTGTLKHWVTAATRHHLEVVSRQLASLV